MSLKFKKILGILAVAGGIFLSPIFSKADENKPTNSFGNFGLGFEVGDPGSWGVSGKFWVDRTIAFQPAVKFGNTNPVLQLDCLLHNFNMGDQMPIYIGLGANLMLQNPTVFAGRVPLGISYLFDKRDFPVDLYLQAVPTLWFFNASLTTFNVYGELGAHIYL
ncbi:MAG TPA: hypothetical protein VIJ93_01275 [bacterium]